MSSERLNVIALISGGKDSFFSLLHCMQHGHRIVALANLFPTNGSDASLQVQAIDPAEEPPSAAGCEDDDASATDLNSFMYQTVGHEVIPLYAAATGIPLYRQPILGDAVRHERDYDSSAGAGGDETESMLSLLQAVKARHPEANGLSAGAILSTYQRTRVESVALRLGLTPLAYLWKYTALPPPSLPADPAQLLLDMAAAGLEARIIKVASAGLDDRHLWERVSSNEGAERVKAALRKFGAADGAALGEGGEFETLVVNGPSRLFRKRIDIPDKGRTAVDEGGGSKWLMLRGAQLQDKLSEDEQDAGVREPDLLDARFKLILDEVVSSPITPNATKGHEVARPSSLLRKSATVSDANPGQTYWSVLADADADCSTIQNETHHVVGKIKLLLASASLEPSDITSIIIALRDMSDFPQVNAEYGRLFTKPNPPSRITISCGDHLPANRSIMVHVVAQQPLTGDGAASRDGLHVQSRSYWAPANIGPYSQAISVPVTSQGQPSGLRSIYIAGQIPLIPASMLLPSQSDTSPQLQVVLSLQHLWRIGIETKVQYWTSAVAYFSRTQSPEDMDIKAKLAGRAWKLVHDAVEDDDAAEDGPDLWDLKYNPEYSTLAGNDEQTKVLPLPDHSILTLRQQNEPESSVPPMFAIEVEQLPRDSLVEWHAHTGLSQVEESSVEMIPVPETSIAGWRAWHTIVRASAATVVYTVLAHGLHREKEKVGFESIVRDMTSAHEASLRALVPDMSSAGSHAPYLAYLDATAIDVAGSDKGASAISEGVPFAYIPSHSIRSATGERLDCVAFYKAVFDK